MKKVLFSLLCVFSAACMFTSCSQEDPRDEFVGNYTFSETGSVDMYSAGTYIGNIPMDSQGSFKISKVGSGNEIKITGDIDNMTGFVKNHEIIFESYSTSGVNDGVTVAIEYLYGNAKFVQSSKGLKLTWNTEVVVNMVSSSGATASGVGTLKMVSSK